MPPSYISITATTFMPLFRASISHLDELHMVLEVNIEFNKIYAISQEMEKWLLSRPLDGGNNNYNKEEGNFNENNGNGRRKLVLINITFFDANLIMAAINKEFLSSRISLPTFNAKFVLCPPTPFQQDPMLEPIKVKNTLTGQVFMWAYSEPVYGKSTILMRCCNSEAESNKQAQFMQTNELNNITWHLRPGKLYKSPQELSGIEEEKKNKLPPDLEDLL